MTTCRVLEKSIPNLEAFINDDASSLSSNDNSSLSCDLTSRAGDSSSQQFRFLLSKLVCAMSKKAHPFAFLFEDLHWSDQDALGKIDEFRNNISAWMLHHLML